MVMSNCNNNYYSSTTTTFHLHFQFFFFFLILLLPNINPLSFNFPSFEPNEPKLKYQGDAFSSNKVIQLTKNQLDSPLTSSVGRATYSEPMHLWDSATGRLTDFNTHFSFNISELNNTNYGDGLAFLLAPFGSAIPQNSTGGFLGLFSEEKVLNNLTRNPTVAVEFDTYPNPWDPWSDHVGINVNSIVSVATITWESSMKDGRRANAWVSYNSTTKNLSVFLTYAENPVFSGQYSVSHLVDLSKVLPERVSVGFSAATGDCAEIHNIISWEFNSTLEIEEQGKENQSSSSPHKIEEKQTSFAPKIQEKQTSSPHEIQEKQTSSPPENKEKQSSKIGLVVGGLVVGLGVLGFCLFIWFKKKRRVLRMNSDVSMDDEFEKGTGPKRFSYSELIRATSNFDEEGKLGEGGFGGVYKGFLTDLRLDIAVKRVSKGSKQGKKEYASEVRIISRLRHRNLVQLIGWCHERSELLLVYEFMPNRSLDYHLFRPKEILTWKVRYKIALGLASALRYLHEEWEQCVVHRDIKSSNVMLDSSFNAKLGDFGLARIVDHGLGSETTFLAGTMGYLAPECVTTRKSNKESDVYSFGIVALEIACGRRPVELNKVNLIEWVWDLYGRGMLVEAADKRLDMDFDKPQIECLMVVGLWCAHPDHTSRPSIRQVINVLNFESPTPNIPSKLPTLVYFTPPMHLCKLATGSNSGLTGSNTDGTQCSCSSCTTNLSQITTSSSGSSSTSKALLHST